MSTPVTTKPSSIATRKKSYGVVHAALTIHSGAAVDLLENRKTTPPQDGRVESDEANVRNLEDTTYHGVFAHLATELEDAKEGMMSANTEHLRQLAKIVKLKRHRDELTGTLLSRFLKARHTFETLYGSDNRFPVLAISGDTPTDPTGLIIQVWDSVSFLEDPQVEPPAHDLLGIELDLPTLAGQLSAGADELDGVLVEINEAEKQADGTRETKNNAIGAYDQKFLRVARVAESIFHFAGMHELATRVRPSTRRPGRRLADEDNTGAETEAQTVDPSTDSAAEAQSAVSETETDTVASES